MLQTVLGLYRAFEEGMTYWRIAAQHEGNPDEMTRHITAVMLTKHGAPVLAGAELPATETLEEVAGRAA